MVEQLHNATGGISTSEGNEEPSSGPTATQSNNAGADEGVDDGAEEEQEIGAHLSKLSPVGDAEAQDEAKGPKPVYRKSSSATPPKKMLSLRSNGKLTSPKSQSEAMEAQAKRGPGRPKGNTSTRANGVVIIKYGKRKKTRMMLGQKISAILSAPQTSNQGATATVAAKEPLSMPEKPPHPFFTVGMPRGPEKAGTIPREGALKTKLKNDSAIPKITSSKESRVNSRPPSLPASADPIVTFGLPTFGADHARITRFPGAQEPLWPPSGMVRVVSPSKSPDICGTRSDGERHQTGGRKLKQAQINIPADEEVLRPLVKLTHSIHSEIDAQHGKVAPKARKFRRPQRHLMSGRELQEAIRPRLLHAFTPPISSETEHSDELGAISVVRPHAPPSLNHLYEGLATSRTAFDKFEWESQDWAHKYAPRTAEHILQQGREAVTIRDWLRSLIVTSVSTQNAPTHVSKQLKPGKRKRRRTKELDDFLVSSDEETAEMVRLSDSEDVGSGGLNGVQKTVIRNAEQAKMEPGQRNSHAIVLSGPSGCGKSAAVYAIAQELGFEIFEINAGSRRSGKDIMDKVGDMTRNHLVRNEPDPDQKETDKHAEDLERINEKLQQDLASGRQGTMKSFFQSKGPAKKRQSPKGPQKVVEKASHKMPQSESKGQKQSLILLEEVDVLFEEDKMFWMTVLDLIINTRRPVIMTCTNEGLLPIDDMTLYGIFRFSPCPEQLATDYLLLLASSEGHLLERDAISALYSSKAFDLRASITELQFFCQMAIGDRKGGLEWMLLDSKLSWDQGHEPPPVRVVSEQTYYKSLGWLGGEQHATSYPSSIEHEVEISLLASDMWDVDPIGLGDTLAPGDSAGREDARADTLNQLQKSESLSEAYSLADILPTCELRRTNMVPLDNTQPIVSEKVFSQYVQGIPLLQADIQEDMTGTTVSLALTLRTIAARLANTQSKPESSPNMVQGLLAAISQPLRNHYSDSLNQVFTLSAFDPIARSEKPALGILKVAQLSTFETPVSTIAEDLAPYIRSIVSYDLRLEEQRRQLEATLSQTGKNRGKTRKTRASRAALEGGSKANTRRERWFPKETSFDLVLQTGGKGWQEVLLSMAAIDTPEPMASADASIRSTPASSMDDELR